MSANRFHQDPFIIACQKIESDANFQPKIANEDLLDLVVDKEGNTKYIPRRSALAIQHSDISNNNNIPLDGKSRIYQIKVATKSCLDAQSEYPVWNVDDSVVILVNKKGEYSFHARVNAEMGNFNSPLTHLRINQYLNQPSLHTPQKNIQSLIQYK